MRSRTGYIFLLCVCISCNLLKKKTGPSGSVDGIFATDTNSNRQLYYSGEAAYLLGNLDEARKIFERFVTTSPEPAAGYYRLSEIALKKEDRAVAADLNRKAREKDAGNEYYQLQYAQLLELDKKFGVAGEIYLQRTYQHPKYWSLYQDAIKNFNRAKNAERMLATCRLWEKQFGLREEIAYNYSAAYQRLGHEDSALYIQKRLIEKYPERWKYKEKLWQYYLAKGYKKEALAIYEQIIQDDPDNTGVPVIMCEHQKMTARLSTEHWQALYALAANHRLEYNAKESCIHSVLLLGIPTDAPHDSLMKLIRILDRLHLGEAKYLDLSGQYFMTKEDLSQFTWRYDLMHSKFPNKLNAWNNLLHGLKEAKQYKRMAAVADSMSELFPNDVEPYYYQALGYLHIGQYQRSIDAAKNAIPHDYESAWLVELSLIIANDLKSLSRYDESMQKVNEVLAMVNNNPEALALKAELTKLINSK